MNRLIQTKHSVLSIKSEEEIQPNPVLVLQGSKLNLGIKKQEKSVPLSRCVSAKQRKENIIKPVNFTETVTLERIETEQTMEIPIRPVPQKITKRKLQSARPKSSMRLALTNSHNSFQNWQKPDQILFCQND